jgi:siroheme synthase-like protein
MTLLPKNKQVPVKSDKTPGDNPLFPVFLKLHNLHTVIVGAGNVGLEKLAAILQNSPQARVTVVAPEVLPTVREIAAKYKTVAISEKTFSDDDLDNADLVIAATITVS